MKITMYGKYAYRQDPYTQVRILCVDRPGHGSDPVASMDPVTGFIRYHTESGNNNTTNFDLVPLQEKLPDLWVNLHPNATTFFGYKDEVLARKCGDFSSKTVKYIPAPDQTS